jgi:serine/threonine protein phosphatase PrpC
MHTPVQVTLTEEDLCVIVATDGLWEFMSLESIADIVGGVSQSHSHDESECLKATLEQLSAAASVAWNDAEGVSDDISIVLGLVGGTVMQ